MYTIISLLPLSRAVSEGVLTPTPPCPGDAGWTAIDTSATELAPRVAEGVAETTPPFFRAHLTSSSGNESLQAPAVNLRCQTTQLRGIVMGPFFTSPGNWTSMLVPIGNDILRAGDHIERFVGDAIRWDGSALSRDELHVHHLHVRHGNAIHWFETHGDSPMQDSNEGHTTVLPYGDCVVHRGFPTQVEAQFANDVQPGRRTEWFFRVAFWIKPVVPGREPCRPVSKLLFQNPTTTFARADPWHRYDVGNEPSLFWWTFRLPRTGRVVANDGNTWKHAHPARYGGLVIVRGRHERLVPAMTDRLDGLRVFSLMVLHEGGTFNFVRESIIERARSRGEFMCSLQPPQDASAMPRASPRSECANVSFTAGDWVTVYAPSEVRMSPRKSPFPQHTMLFWIFRDDAHRLGEYVEIVPRAYGQWVPGRVPDEGWGGRDQGQRPWYQWEHIRTSSNEEDVEAQEQSPLYTLVV